VLSEGRYRGNEIAVPSVALGRVHEGRVGGPQISRRIHLPEAFPLVVVDEERTFNLPGHLEIEVESPVKRAPPFERLVFILISLGYYVLPESRALLQPGNGGGACLEGLDGQISRSRVLSPQVEKGGLLTGSDR